MFNVKLKFYRAFNALYSHSHCSNSEMVSVELLKAYYIPLLLYGVEATAPSRQVIQMMERCIDVAVKKIFKVSTTENCEAIKFCVGLDHIDEIIKKRNCKFMNSLVAHHFVLDVMQLAFNELFTVSF